MILDVDIGNSLVKWRISAAAEVSGATTVGQLDLLVTQLAPYSIERVRVACVAGAAAELDFRLWCERQFAVTPEFARVRAHHGGVTVGYQEPERLGVDRWLAMLAAYHQVQDACVVLDAGSAVTVDFIDATGMHLGGLILPGAQLMARALSQTSAIQLDTLHLPREWQPGCDTLACVENAVAAAFAGLVDQIIDQGERRCGKDFAFMVCGGDAGAVVGDNARLRIRPDLVLDGLSLGLP